MRRRAIGGAVVLLAVVGVLAGGGCTRRHTIPTDRQPCAAECARGQGSCTRECAEDKGNPAVLEDVRAGLCEKRCKESYESCMLDCL